MYGTNVIKWKNFDSLAKNIIWDMETFALLVTFCNFSVSPTLLCAYLIISDHCVCALRAAYDANHDSICLENILWFFNTHTFLRHEVIQDIFNIYVLDCALCLIIEKF